MRPAFFQVAYKRLLRELFMNLSVHISQLLTIVMGLVTDSNINPPSTELPEEADELALSCRSVYHLHF